MNINDKIKKYFKLALKEFILKDNNMDLNCSERAKVHRIALYLENMIKEDSLFDEYVVDCDYNRVFFDNNVDAKRLPDDFYDDGVNHNNTFMTDLIVHRRNTNDNLLYCEFKNTNESVLDKKKISLLTSGQHYIEYCLATSIIFNKLNLDNIDKEVIFLENDKIKFMQKISFDKFQMIYSMYDITNLVNAKGCMIFGELKNLFDVYLWLDEIIKLKLSAESRLEKVKKLKEFLYDNSEHFYKIICKYDDVEIYKIVTELKQMFSCPDLIEIKSRIHDPIYVKRNLLWDIYNFRLNGDSMEVVSKKTGYPETVLRRIIIQLRSEYRRVGILVYIKKLIEKLCAEFSWSNNYVYTCKELEVVTNKEMVNIVNFIYFLNDRNSTTISRLSWFFIDYYNLEKRYKEIGYENLCDEINKNKFLSNKSKIFLLRRLERYIDKDVDNDEDNFILNENESKNILNIIIDYLKSELINFNIDYTKSSIKIWKNTWVEDGEIKIYLEITPEIGKDFDMIYGDNDFRFILKLYNNKHINKKRKRLQRDFWVFNYSFVDRNISDSISDLKLTIYAFVKRIDYRLSL